MSKMSSRPKCPIRHQGAALPAKLAGAGADERPSGLQKLAIIEIGLPHYASTLVFPTEVGLAFFDGRPPSSWLVEPEERWSTELFGDRNKGGQELGEGLPGSTIIEQLKSAIVGLNLYSRNQAYVSRWLGRLCSACGSDVVIRVGDLRSFALPASFRRELPTPMDITWALQWSKRKVPEMSRAVTHAARDLVFLQELDRLTGPNE